MFFFISVNVALKWNERKIVFRSQYISKRIIKTETHAGKSHENKNIKTSVSHVKVPGSISKKRFIKEYVCCTKPQSFRWMLGTRLSRNKGSEKRLSLLLPFSKNNKFEVGGSAYTLH